VLPRQPPVRTRSQWGRTLGNYCFS